MDPLSVAASIIAVAGALYKVSQKLRECAKTLAHAAKEIVAVAREMDACSTLFRTLQCTIEQVTPLLPREFNVVKICEDLVSQALESVGGFRRFLKGLEPLSHSRDARNVFAKTIARLKWAFQRTDLVLLRSKLESSKTTIHLYLTMMYVTVVAGQLKAAERRGQRDRRKIKELRHQVKLLTSQLRDQRVTVKDAITATGKLEYDLRGPGRPSHSLEVARQALSIAKTQLEQYDRQWVFQGGDRWPRTNPSASRSSSTTSNDSSPRPGPSRSPRPPTSYPLPSAPAPHPQFHPSTQDANRRTSTMAYDMPDPRTGVVGEPSTSRHTRVDDAPGRGVHPMATDVASDMGYRTARAVDRRTDRGIRIRDADRNLVWEQNHQGDDD